MAQQKLTHFQFAIIMPMVAPKASARLHFGFSTKAGYDELYRRSKEIIETSFVKGTISNLSGGISFLPMEKTTKIAKLYNLVKDQVKKLKIDLKEQHTRGDSDAGFPASLGIPTLCGMGPFGGNWHREDEYMELDTFASRTKLLAQSIFSTFENFNRNKLW